MAPVILEASKVTKSYASEGNELRVLSDLQLSIAQSERVGVIGESGVGKSTLLHILGGLDRPTSGSVVLNGQDLFTLTDGELAGVRNRCIGFVFQFHHLLPDFTAVENVMMPGLIANLGPDEARSRAMKILDRVGLATRFSHRPGELSGGEQQRVAVARALVLEPMLILADEPTGNLDAESGQRVLDILGALHSDFGVAMIVVTHSEKLAGEMDRTLRLTRGSLDKIV